MNPFRSSGSKRVFLVNTPLPTRIILASASPRRVELLGGLGLEFEIIPSHSDEVEGGHFTPSEVARINAWRKARAVAVEHPDALIIGADTVVALGTRLFGKPGGQAEAARVLRCLSGKTHEVITGVCLMRKSTAEMRLFAERTFVTFHALTPKDIRGYLAKVHVLDKAGSYAIQERGSEIVRTVEGSYSNVVGLPVERLRAVLAETFPDMPIIGAAAFSRQPRAPK